MKKLITTVSIIVCLVSCKKNSGESNANSMNDSVLVSLRDSALFAWKILATADSQKFADIKRLLEEVSYTKSPDEVKLAKYKSAYQTLVSEKLTLDKIANSDAIDKNDILVDSVISEIQQFAINTPNSQDYPLIDELIKDISYANSANTMAIQRANYDKHALNFNNYLIKIKSESEKPFPLFALPYQP